MMNTSLTYNHVFTEVRVIGLNLKASIADLNPLLLLLTCQETRYTPHRHPTGTVSIDPTQILVSLQRCLTIMRQSC